MVRQDDILLRNGKTKFRKLYADYSIVDDLTPTDPNGCLLYQTPDLFITDRGIVSIARCAFGCDNDDCQHCAENLSLFDDQEFIQTMFSNKTGAGYCNAAVVELGFPFCKDTPEDILYNRFQLLLPALLNATDKFGPRLLDNTLRSITTLSSLSPRCFAVLIGILDSIKTRPTLKKRFWDPFHKKKVAFQNDASLANPN
jgi:hypothetical protein